MTLDLLLFFVSLALMAAVVVLRRPITLLSVVTVAQWYVGAELAQKLQLQVADSFQVALEFGFRLSLPLLGLLLLKRQTRRPKTIELLLVVVWAIVFSGLSLQILLPELPFGSGYFYLLMETYQIHLLAILLGLSFISSLGKTPKRKSK